MGPIPGIVWNREHSLTWVGPGCDLRGRKRTIEFQNKEVERVDRITDETWRPQPALITADETAQTETATTQILRCWRNQDLIKPYVIYRRNRSYVTSIVVGLTAMPKWLEQAVKTKRPIGGCLATAYRIVLNGLHTKVHLMWFPINCLWSRESFAKMTSCVYRRVRTGSLAYRQNTNTVNSDLFGNYATIK